MVREIAIFIYLFIFRILFFIFKWFPQKEKTTFVASFGDNVLFTLQELEKHSKQDTIILKTAQCKVHYVPSATRTIIDFSPRKVFAWIQSIYHLATSRHIFVDNYYGFLAVTSFKKGTTCVQLWHAAGAIKQFGLKDLSNEHRSRKAFNRFKKVYNRFTHVVVGSDHMATIFEEGFDLPNERMLRTGVPRTDFFFNKRRVHNVRALLQQDFPMKEGKKVLLYAPTYRDDELEIDSIALDIDRFYEEFHEEYILLLRLHPAVSGTLANTYPDFVYDVSTYPNINHLLLITDVLISDYSSIPFEFALLERPMIFFAYDLDEYARERGFWDNYNHIVPGPVVETNEALIQAIHAGEYDMEAIRSFRDEWNTYSSGNSSKRLVEEIYQTRAHAE